MGVTVKGVECGVVEWVKCGALRRFGHVMRMEENAFVKSVYEGRIEGGGVRGRPPVKWINKVSEYWSKRVGVAGLNVLRGSAKTGRDEDTSAPPPPPGGKFPRWSKASEI